MDRVESELDRSIDLLSISWVSRVGLRLDAGEFLLGYD